MKINKSAMENLNFLQIVDDNHGNLKITNDEIRFTPDFGVMSNNPDSVDRIHKKEVILKRRKTKQ
jgi:hypothetical protein